MYWFVIDIVMAVIVVISVLISAHRGLVGSLIRLLGLVLALVAATIASRTLAEPIFNEWFRAGLVDAVAEKLSGITDIRAAAEAIGEGLIGILLGIFGQDAKLASFLQDVAFNDARSVAEAVVDSVIKGSYTAIIGAVLFAAVLMLTLIVISIVIRATGIINRIPFVGGINRLLGAVLGIFYGIALCYIGVVLFATVFFSIGRGTDYERIISENTVIFSYFYRYNPILG